MYTFLPEVTDVHIKQHSHQKDLNLCLSLHYYLKVIVELEKKTQTRNLTVFMVLVIWPSSTLKFLFVSINFNWFFLLISINVWAIFSLRDRRQITFVRVNGFCALNKRPSFHPSVFNGQNQAGWDSRQNRIKYTCLLVHSLSSFEGTSYEKNTRYS